MPSRGPIRPKHPIQSLTQRENKLEQSLATKIDDRTATIGVIGLGYVGLPLVQAFVNAGFRTMGFDIDTKKIEQLNLGESYISHIDGAAMREIIEADKFEPTADMARLGEADALLICVPTPLTENREPDLSYVESTTEQIAASLRPGQLVCLESTTYPGTTRDLMLPLLAATGLEHGKDFFVAYSPEREDPGNKDYSADRIPKVVGGLDAEALDLACRLYSAAVVEVVPVSSPEVAEACKILENTYRAINIALVNELKILLDRMDVDVWEVIDAAKTKPFGFQAFYPGPGLGGHCIPIDPFYLSWVARRHGLSTKFIELAGEVNTGMPRYVVQRTSDALNEVGKPLKGSKICILGVAYKPDVSDPRESPAFELMKLLDAAGADISYSDPHIPVLPKMRRFDVPDLTSETLTAEFLGSLDCAMIVTNHSDFDYEAIVRHAPLVVDTRNATSGITVGREKIRKA